MDTRPTSFVLKFAPFLRYAEIAGLLMSAAGLALHYQDPSKGSDIILIGFTTLATTFYLYAFVPPPNPESPEQTEQKPKGILELYSIMVRKVSYIGCSVCVVGLLFRLLHLTGAHEMMLIGAASLGMTCLFSIVYVAANSERLPQVQAYLLRAVPLLLLTAYWLYQKPSVVH